VERIFLPIAIFIVGIAATYTWRDRISKARRAKEREQQARRSQLASGSETKTNAVLSEVKSFIKPSSRVIAGLPPRSSGAPVRRNEGC
jgi:hypothetical protein